MYDCLTVNAETPRAEWAIDDVVIAFNDSSETGFEEDFSNSLRPDVWYMTRNAVPRITCQSRDNALEFSKNGHFLFSVSYLDQLSAVLNQFLCLDNLRIIGITIYFLWSWLCHEKL